MKCDVKCESKLVAKINFKEDVAPKFRKIVGERLILKSKDYGVSPLSQYLDSKGLSNNSILNFGNEKKFNSYLGEGVKINYRIRTNPRKLTLNLEAKSEKDIKIQDFFDIEKLKNYVLHGEI